MQAPAVRMLRDSALFLVEGSRQFLSEVYGDLFSPTMREDAIIQLEKQFGLRPAETDTLEDRRSVIELVWRAGGQGPGVLQEKLQAAGFDVIVVENIPYADLTLGDALQMTTATTNFTMTTSVSTLMFGENEAGYLLGNGRLLQEDGSRSDPVVTPVAAGAGQAPTFGADVPPAALITFGAVAGKTFGNEINRWAYVFSVEGTGGALASIASQRREAFERIILQWKPAHLAVLLRVEFT